MPWTRLGSRYFVSLGDPENQIDKFYFNLFFYKFLVDLNFDALKKYMNGLEMSEDLSTF